MGADDSIPEFLGRTPEQWLARLQSAQPQERTEAAWAIAELAVRDPLLAVRLAHNDDSIVRYWGVQGLQRSALATGESNSTRKMALRAVVPLLADKTPAVRIVAAETLGLLGDPDRALPVLVAAMSHPQDAVRIQAIAGLERLGEAARPAEKTLQAATTDTSEYVKRISTRALQKLETTRK
ncbi:MAG TPA: HEAT repeat domain-containing protein [Pirellulaceae bacterium]|nr:HEAT repeat domain-containing protein [Pirellulaceae bacterium]